MARVEADELSRLRAEVGKRFGHYSSRDLEGAGSDAVYALETAGFTTTALKKTGEPERMMLYRCSPDWAWADADEVARRLETAWAENGAFTDEAHLLSVEDTLVALDFVTWWNAGPYYTGRIEVPLSKPK